MADRPDSADSLPGLTVVYPRPGQVVTAADSTFIFGHVSPGEHREPLWLLINGVPVTIHPEGGFLAFLPISPGDFTFRLEASFAERQDVHSSQWRRRRTLRSDDTTLSEVRIIDSLTVQVPAPVVPPPLDSLVILEEHQPPMGDLVQGARDLMRFGFRGTPACRAWCEIPGVADSIPMAETSSPSVPYWGDAVFGSNPITEGDTEAGSGIYTGLYRVTEADRANTVHLIYHLAGPPAADPMAWENSGNDTIDSTRSALLAHKKQSPISRASSYTVTLNAADYPFTVRFIDSVQIIRHGPRKGYLAIFQPVGVEALAVAAEGPWYKVMLSPSLSGWVHWESVEPLAHGILPPRSYLTSIRTYAEADKLVVTFPLSGRHPFRVIEEGRRMLRVQLFGVISDTDWIRYDFKDKLIRLATWSQPEPDVYELKLELSQDIWGYDTYFRGNTLCLQLNRPPPNTRLLKGKRIVIDPGHSRDPGAVGPTGYTEADANLAVSLRVQDELESRGADVVLTRSDGSHVELYDRPAIARACDADLFISIHNNALPDGVNPFENNGTSTYFYHPHSIRLARRIHDEMLRATGLPDHGLYQGNLAVIRPTQYPAVLVECAFMIIPQQEALLKTEDFRREVAKAITRGIVHFLKDYDHEEQ